MADSVSDNVRSFIVKPDDNDIRLDRWFKRHLTDIPFALVSRWVRTGQVRLDGARTDVNVRILEGQTIRVPPASALPTGKEKIRVELTPEQIELAESMVLHKDKSAIVLNKLPGLATQGGTKTHEHIDGLLDAFIDDEFGRPKLVHRLDKDTSGVLLVGRTAGAAAYFSKQFAGRRTRKIYWALVMGVPEIYDGVVDLPLAKQPGTGGEKMHVDMENGQSAKSRYRLIERVGSRAAWVELQPFTGRTHQLRAHMAAIGHPIVGDGKYGGKDAFLTGSISRKMHLHARRLKIPMPGGGSLDISAPPPEHFAETLKQLGLEEWRGDLLADDENVPMSREQEKQNARRHSKNIRKERRGERRSRSGGDTPVKGKPDTRKKTSASAAKAPVRGKPAARGKPASARSSGKPSARPSTRRGPKS